MEDILHVGIRISCGTRQPDDGLGWQEQGRERARPCFLKARAREDGGYLIWYICLQHGRFPSSFDCPERLRGVRLEDWGLALILRGLGGIFRGRTIYLSTLTVIYDVFAGVM